MMMLMGEPVYEGTVSGPLKWFERPKREDQANCFRHFPEAVEEVKKQTGQLYQKMLREAGKEAADIFQAHLMILEDPDFEEMVMDGIKTQGRQTAEAIRCAGKTYYDMFASMDDAYMKERAADVADITSQLLHVVTGGTYWQACWKSPVILCAQELYPSEIARLDRNLLMAVATEKGSAVSHMAILARNLKIPAVTGIGSFPEGVEGRRGTLNAGMGTFCLE